MARNLLFIDPRDDRQDQFAAENFGENIDFCLTTYEAMRALELAEVPYDLVSMDNHVAGPGWRSPRSEILRCAGKQGADLIVMGAHDRGPRSTLRHLGATSDGVVRQAGCGVLIVRPSAAGPPRSNPIAVPADVAV